LVRGTGVLKQVLGFGFWKKANQEPKTLNMIHRTCLLVSVSGKTQIPEPIIPMAQNILKFRGGEADGKNEISHCRGGSWRELSPFSTRSGDELEQLEPSGSNPILSADRHGRLGAGSPGEGEIIKSLNRWG
jgi:hypothetical protein